RNLSNINFSYAKIEHQNNLNPCVLSYLVKGLTCDNTNITPTTVLYQWGLKKKNGNIITQLTPMQKHSRMSRGCLVSVCQFLTSNSNVKFTLNFQYFLVV
ncbi:hypothetical protein ACROYT_G012057, partial [Oculina patagonica]